MTKKYKHPNRETWMLAAIDAQRDAFKQAGGIIPAKIRVSIGFPGGGSPRKRIGECWSGSASADGVVSMFVSPTIAETTGPVSILAVLVHELVHAVGHMNHKAGFKKLALAVGLEGKMTATVAGEALNKRLVTLAKALGPWPGSRLDLSKAPTKKQTTRLLKVECIGCGFIVRASATALADAGLPTCGCGTQMVCEAIEGEDE